MTEARLDKTSYVIEIDFGRKRLVGFGENDHGKNLETLNKPLLQLLTFEKLRYCYLLRLVSITWVVLHTCIVLCEMRVHRSSDAIGIWNTWNLHIISFRCEVQSQNRLSRISIRWPRVLRKCIAFMFKC